MINLQKLLSLKNTRTLAGLLRSYKMVANNWTVEVQEDPETKELILPLSVDLLAQMGWSEGTELFWHIKDGQ